MRKRRILGILMALTLCLSLLPATALADSDAECKDGENCTHEAAVTVDGTTTHYDTIAAALKAAGGENGTGGTVKLLKDSFLESEDKATTGTADTYSTFIYKDITLDLNEKTLTCNAEVAGISVRPGVHFTIQNGVFENKSSTWYATAIEASKVEKADGTGYTGCTISVISATIKANYGVYAVGYTEVYVHDSTIEGDCPVYGAGPTNKVTLNGATIIGKEYGVCQEPYDPNYFLNKDVAGSVYEIYSSTIKGGDDYAGVCINNYITNVATGNHTLLVEDSQITGGSGIETKRTDVTIKGENTKITATGNQAMNSDGDPVSSGYALAATYYSDDNVPHNTASGEKYAAGILTIESGNFKGAIGIQEPADGAQNEASITISGGTFEADVTAYLAEGLMQDANGNVIKIVSAESITLNETELEMYTNGTEKLTATVTPDNTTDTIEWSSSNTDVATVENGLVAAVGEGTATITAKAGGQEATCKVVVTRREYRISAAPSALDFGNAYPAYQQPGAQTVTITNTGNQSVTLAQPAADDWLVVGELSKTALSPDETATFTVQPKADLPVGTYSTTITITGSGSNDDVSTDVTVSFAVVERPVSSGGTAPVRDITVDSGSHGDVEIWPEEAKQGTTVTITATPDKGYEVAEVVVTDENGTELTVTDKGNGKYTFTMPNSDVTIEVTFQAVSGGSTSGGDLTITAPAGWVNPYTDVAANAWYYNAVGYASANGLMGGVGNNAFAPSGTMNRAMVWTVIGRLAGQTISGESWAADAQAWAVAQGVSDGTNPDGAVTREELVTMLYRYAGSPAMNVPELGLIGNYPDSAAVSAWAQNAFAWAISKGVIEGRDGKLAAGESITRAEAATILARFHMLTK